MEETDFYKITESRTLHGLKKGWAYYNYEGTHFRVFSGFRNGLIWLDTRNDKLVIADFEDEEKLDDFLENNSPLCMDCINNPLTCKYKVSGSYTYGLFCDGFKKSEGVTNEI